MYKQMAPIINVTKTYLPKIDRYQTYLNRIWESGWLTNNGELVQELELKLKDYLDVKNLILVANGTLALQLAFKLLELSGEVITTPFSFVATTSSLVWEGLNPVFSDIGSKTLNLDPGLISSHINSNTSAILPVHVFGNPAEITQISKIAKKNKLKIVYDASHAFGIKYDNKGIGNFGDISTFSFHSTKVFHTIEGGALAINDDSLAEKARLMINFGIPGPDEISELGINCKMNEFQAAMGLCVLEDFDEILYERENIYDKYLKNFDENNELLLPEKNRLATRNYSYFPVVFNRENSVLAVMEQLAKKNIRVRRYFYPSLETLNYVKKNQFVPISTDISKRVLCLPIYNGLDSKTIDIVIRIVDNYTS